MGRGGAGALQLIRNSGFDPQSVVLILGDV